MNGPHSDLPVISPARREDVGRIIEIDLAAGQLFAPTGLLSAEALEDHVPEDDLLNAIDRGFLKVARTRGGLVAGFFLASERGNGLYLEQISVDPAFGKKGIGRQLMQHLFDLAEDIGVNEITLSTFRSLAWNGPFYTRLGFEEVDREQMEPFMLEIEEAQAPYMDVSKRMFMKKPIRKAATRDTKRS